MVDAPFMLKNISCVSYVRPSSSDDLPKRVCTLSTVVVYSHNVCGGAAIIPNRLS